MSNVLFEDATLDQRETAGGVLRQLWEDVERLLALPPTASRIPVPARAGATAVLRREAADATPTRVRYTFD